MLFTVESQKGLEEVCTKLQEAIVKRKFGVMAVHDLKATMAKKGVAFDRECRIFEVCNPHQAKKVLEENADISTALPCRISAYAEGEKTILATIRPTALMAIFQVHGLESVAQEVEASIIRIMEEAAA